MAIDDNTSYELTGAQVKDLANKIKGKAADNTFVGATSAAPGSKGLVPEPQAGDNTKFLSGDCTWQTVPAVNNGALTIQQNGTTLDTFTANSSDDKTVNIQTITAETVAPAEEVGAITTNMIADGAVTSEKVDWTAFKFPIPDYSNGTSISNSTKTWTAPKCGVVIAVLVADTTNGYKNVTIAVNGQTVASAMWAGVTGGYNIQTRAIVPVATGDVVTFSATDGQSTVSGRMFYPYKWA